MRKLFPSVVWLGLLATACSGGSRSVLPTAPSPVPAQAPTPPAPFAFAVPYTEITVGDVVTRHETSDDPTCDQLPGWHCQFLRMTAPSDGLFGVLVTYSVRAQPLDLSLLDSRSGSVWAQTAGPGPRVALTARVKAGTTYQLTVWYTTPGMEFELQSSLEPE